MTVAAQEPADLLDTPEAGGAAIRGGAVRLVGYGVTLVLALAAAPLLVRHLGLVDFGRYTLVLSLMALVQGVTEGGLGAVGLREYAVLPERERNELMRQLIGLRLVLTVAGVCGAVAFTVIAGYDSELIVGTIVAGGGLLTLVLFNLVSIPLAVQLRLGWLTAAEIARAVAMTALIVVLVLAGAGMVPLLATQIPAGLIALAVVFGVVRGLSARASFDRARWWALARDTLPYAAAIAIAAIYFRITIVIMSLVASDEQTGYFAVSYRVVEVLVGIPLLLASAAFPIISRAARDDPARLRYAAQRTLDLMAMAGVWLALVLALAAPFVIDVLAGDGYYEPSVDTLRIQAAALACTFVGVPCGLMLLALHRHREILYGNLVPLVLGVALTLVLAPSHGAKGAAVATVIAEAGLAAALLVMAGRNIALSLKGFGAIAVAVALAGAAGVLILSVAHPVVAAIGATVVYALALVAMRQFPPELAIALRERKRSGG